MFASLWLFTCVLVSGQSAGTSEWRVLPRLSRGQELVYFGSYGQEGTGQGVKFGRRYQLETRILVLETSSDGAQVALFTAIKPQHQQPPADNDELRSARLRMARIDPQGRLLAEPGENLPLPLDGPPTLETGAFLEFPDGPVGPDSSWEVTEDNRPPRTWKVVGTESINGVLCLKIIGVQQSPDWDHPRADRTSWRRQDTVWVSPSAGFAGRLERVIERREPTRQVPDQRLLVNYHLESSLVYPGQLFDIRKREIALFQSYVQAAEACLSYPGQNDLRTLDSLLSKLRYHCENQPPTPYRDALLQLQRRLEARRRGD